jgi:lysophospholipase L1-like esterase
MTRAAFEHAARLVIACILVCAGCSDDSGPVVAGTPAPKRAVSVHVLALGDSYTSGESVPQSKSWPYQLADSLLEDSVRVTTLKVVAHTGWTTADLIVALNKTTLQPPYDLVTLQIGVNNQFGGVPLEVFQDEFPELVARATTLAGDHPDHVVVLTIPDYSVTPVGQRLDPDQTRGEIDSYNGFIAAALDSTEVNLINITDISREAGEDSSLTARDELHPSGAQYARWVTIIRPVVAALFGREDAGE